MTGGTDERLHRVIAVTNGKGGVGKCLAGDTIVHDAVTGLPHRLDEAVGNPTFRSVASCDLDRGGVVIEAPVSAQVDSGVQPTLRLTTASGRSVTVTPHHPLLLPEGWRRADAVTVGETIAVPARMPQPLMPQPIDDTLVDLLAILLAEGGTTTPDTTVTTTDPQVVARATAGARALGATLTSRGPNSISYQLVGAPRAEVAPGTCGCGCGEVTVRAHTPQHRFAGYSDGQPLRTLRGHGAISTVTQFRRRHGLDGVKAIHKHLPDAVWCLPTEQVARFVGVFTMCDGTVGKDGRVTITLGSERLVRDLQSLFLRLGVQSTVDARTAHLNGTPFPAWNLRVLSQSLPALAAQVPLWGRKRDRLHARVARMATRANPNTGSPTLTADLRASLYAHVHVGSPGGTGRPTLQNVARRIHWNLEGATRPRFDTLMSNPRPTSPYRYLSPTALRGFLDEFDLWDDHGHLLSPDLHWDEVVSITDAGLQPVYDLTVDSTHNFIANDVVVHNTSVAANVAGQITLGDYRVLTVDLDLSGNLGLDLGYITDERADEGLSIFNAVHVGSPLTVIKDVRPGLDVVPGGRRLEAVAALTNLPSEQPGGVPGAFARALAPLAAEYDIVVIDTAPGNPVLQDMALAAARYVIVPLRSDRSGVEGLRLVGPRVKKARDTINPKLTYLGAVIFGHTANASRVRRTAQEHLAVVGDKVPLLDAFVRHSEAVASDSRERGLLAHELAAQVDESKAARLRYLAHRGEETTGEAAPPWCPRCRCRSRRTTPCSPTRSSSASTPSKPQPRGRRDRQPKPGQARRAGGRLRVRARPARPPRPHPDGDARGAGGGAEGAAHPTPHPTGTRPPGRSTPAPAHRRTRPPPPPPPRRTRKPPATAAVSSQDSTGGLRPTSFSVPATLIDRLATFKAAHGGLTTADVLLDALESTEADLPAHLGPAPSEGRFARSPARRRPDQGRLGQLHVRLMASNFDDPRRPRHQVRRLLTLPPGHHRAHALPRPEPCMT